MGQRDVEPACFFGIGRFVTRRFRHPSRSIGSKRRVPSVFVTVKLSRAYWKFSSCAGLRCCGASTGSRYGLQRLRSYRRRG